MSPEGRAPIVFSGSSTTRGMCLAAEHGWPAVEAKKAERNAEKAVARRKEAPARVESRETYCCRLRRGETRLPTPRTMPPTALITRRPGEGGVCLALVAGEAARPSGLARGGDSVRPPPRQNAPSTPLPQSSICNGGTSGFSCWASGSFV